MGSGASTAQIDAVRVSRTKPKYPPPIPPKWFLSEIRSLLRAPDIGGPETRSLDWDTIERTISADQDDDTPTQNDDVITARPSSGIGMSRTDSGLHKNQHKSKNEHKRVLSFNMIDKHAKTALPQHSNSFTDLVDFLKQPIAPELYPDTCLVRALTVWFSMQNTSKSKYKDSDLNTPNGIIQHLRHQSLTVTEAYTLLCRGATIPTVIIHGFVKAGAYHPGDVIDDSTRDVWCGVYVDGSWQLVHPQWVCRGTYGPKKEGWVLIESDEFLANDEAKKLKADKNAVTLKEEFFMPRPDVFIYRCYADHKQWHLIPESKTLRSVEEFALLSYISPSFFKYGLTLASSPYSVQRSNENGIVQIEIVTPKQYAHALNFGYRIRGDESEMQTVRQLKPFLEKNMLERMVINYRSNDRFVFEIRLPVKGTYHFVVTGGFGTELCNLCRFKLECPKHATELLIPQIHPGSDGWGPGPLTERAGLLLPSKPSGLLTIYPQNSTAPVQKNSSVFLHLVTLNFQINRALLRKFEYYVDILPSMYIDVHKTYNQSSSSGESKSDKQHKTNKSKDYDMSPEQHPVRAQCTKDVTSRQFTTHVIGNLAGEETVILIKATEMEIKNNIRVPVKGSTRPVCYYLLSGSTYTAREPTQVKLVKQNLQEAMNTNDINKIESAVDKCLRMKVPLTDDTVAAAESRVEYLKLKKDILDCIKRRNIAVLNETLCRVASYRYREALVFEVEKLLEFRAELQGLQGYTKKLPTLKEAIEELHMLTTPTVAVHNTVMYLCLLVGFEEKLKLIIISHQSVNLADFLHGASVFSFIVNTRTFDKNVDFPPYVENLLAPSGRDWKYIRSCLKVTPDKLNEMVILKRMDFMADKSFPWKSMDMKVLDRVNNGVHVYPYEQVKHIDEMLLQAKQSLKIPVWT